MATFKNFYSRQGLWTLFLMTALPLHIWTFILAFRDFEWISARTNSWDAVGVVAYGLIIALIESAILFLGMTLLGLFVSGKWEERRRIALMSAVVILLSLWSIFNQSYFLAGMSTPAWLANFVIATGRPLVALYAMALFFTSLSFVLPAYLILSSDKALGFMTELMDRLSLLMMLYLFFDVAALVIVVIRNI